MEGTPSSDDASSSTGGGGANVLLLPIPGAQGHTNPMLQFGRRLAYHGLRPTLVATRYVLSTTPPPGVPAAAFFTQPCAVNIVHGELWAGRMALPATDGRALVERGALGVQLGLEDMPPFVAMPELEPEFVKASIGQFDGLEDADDVLVNSFRDFEPKEAKYMESTWRAKMIGPTVPSFYLDDHRWPSNKSYGFNFFSGEESCMDWMEKQSINSVVFVSYGTFSEYEAP